MTHRLWIAVYLITLVTRPTAAHEIADMGEAVARIRQEFGKLDRNQDLQLTADEFQAMAGDKAIRQRDFGLCDFDSNGRLSRDEFACLPGLVEPHLRGSMPDPLRDLVDDAVAALDESYDHWDRRPEELVNAHTFVGNFLGSISPGGKRFVTGRMIDQADRNADGRISRTEAKFFLEQQLGLRLDSGPPLREPTGRLVRYDRFLAMDRNHDGSINRQEWIEGWWQSSPAEESFDSMDHDQDGRLTYEEYAHPTSQVFMDPVAWFRGADVDLNGRLSEAELNAAVEPGREHLAVSALKSFDDDQDGSLSLREYRSSMLANYNYPWDRRPSDENRDGRLSYDEFVFDELDLFQLQRRYFFHRLDLDRDGELSLDEFEFQTRAPLSVRAYSTSGEQSKLLYQNREYPECGWPSVSQDGTRLLLHEYPPGGVAEGRVVSVSLDQSDVRVICQGLQPSWSADGGHFVCERRSRDAGVWIMDASGLSGRRVSAGHGPKWSPDGKRIAFLNDNGVSIFDVEMDRLHPIFLREDHPYQDLGRDIAWAPDSQRLAILGNFAATSQLVILPIDASQMAGLRIRYSFDTNCRGNLNWSAREGILLGLQEIETGRFQMMSLNPDSDEKPKRIERLAKLQGVKSACLSPDGMWYITVVEE